MVLGSFADILFQWEFIGVFDFILPLLLIFAVVYGILSQMHIFKESRGINVIIALVLGLLAIRFRFFTDFLAEIAPRLGVGLVIILTLIILIGLFTPEGWGGIFGLILMGVGGVIFIIIVAQTFDVFGSLGFGGAGSNDLIAYVVLVVLLIGVIVAVAAGGKTEPTDSKIWGKKIANLFKS